jgi:hypothetical protein
MKIPYGMNNLPERCADAQRNRWSRRWSADVPAGCDGAGAGIRDRDLGGGDRTARDRRSYPLAQGDYNRVADALQRRLVDHLWRAGIGTARTWPAGGGAPVRFYAVLVGISQIGFGFRLRSLREDVNATVKPATSTSPADAIDFSIEQEIPRDLVRRAASPSRKEVIAEADDTPTSLPTIKWG